MTNTLVHKIGVFCLIACCLLAEPAIAKTAQNGKSNNNQISSVNDNVDFGFDLQTANKSISQLENDLKSDLVSVKQIQDHLGALTNLTLIAKKCIDNNNTQLEKLNQRLTEISTLTASLPKQEENSLTTEKKYLDSKKNQLNIQLSECRFFSLRAEELTSSTGKKLRELMKTRLLYARPNLFTNLKNFPSAITQIQQDFDIKLFEDKSGITFFMEQNNWLWFLPFGILLVFLYFKYQIRSKIIPLLDQKTHATSLTQAKQSFLSALYYYLSYFTLGIITSLFFSIFTHSLITPSYLALTSYAFLTYLFFAFLVRFYFFLPSTLKGSRNLSLTATTKLIYQINRIGLICLFTYIIFIFLKDQSGDNPLRIFFQNLIMTALCINFLAITWTLKNDAASAKHHFLRFFIYYLFTILFLVILAIEYIGYHLLAFYLLYASIMTILAIWAAKLFNHLIGMLLNNFTGTDRPWQQKLRRSFGLKYYDKFIEVLWLRALFYIVIWLVFLLILSKIWGLAQANFEILLSHLIYGMDVGKLHIVPSRIIIGILIFILLALLTRYLRTSIFKNTEWGLETSSKASLGSIVGYLGFAIAFIFGALIAGVNFSGLALIAGALSVGIGFGLQNIVNNFVSGIILLIERPVKQGDRIIVGDTEGYVKRISIRYTHLTTIQYTDVIVPNSELISKQVTNYMLHDVTYKIFTTVGIAYGSDTELARNTLLEIARAHPLVIIHDKEVEPMVYFTKFGESSLNFELYCVIKDVNFKTQVVSDLNFSIEKAFREKGISIPFPQREIRIKKD